MYNKCGGCKFFQQPKALAQSTTYNNRLTKIKERKSKMKANETYTQNEKFSQTRIKKIKK